MRLKKLLLVCLTVSLPIGLSIGQEAESRRVSDVFIIPTGASFTNITDSTYFALPRYRVERLLRDAMLSDTIRVMWIQDALEREEKSRFWQNATIVTGVVATIELIIIFLLRS